MIHLIEKILEREQITILKLFNETDISNKYLFDFCDWGLRKKHIFMIQCFRKAEYYFQFTVLFFKVFKWLFWSLATHSHELHLDLRVKFPTNLLELCTLQTIILLLEETKQEESKCCKSTFIPFLQQICWPFKSTDRLTVYFYDLKSISYTDI